MRIVIAPDKFKGSFDARAVASAIALGVRRAFPAAETIEIPMADGGQGTLAALSGPLDLDQLAVGVRGALGESGSALIGVSGKSCVIEMAACSGSSSAMGGADAMRATTLGIGDALKASARAGCTEVVLGIGGSASTDGGVGAAVAWGWRFLDAAGHDLDPLPEALPRLHAILAPTTPSPFERVVGVCDVTISLTGPRGAARLFAPQKGASPAQVEELERAMERLGEVMQASLGFDPATIPGSGAGGGMGAGAAAFFGAVLVTGAAFVADVVGLDEAIRGAALVLTGEGRIDRGSLHGKVASEVASRAREAGVPCFAIAGISELSLDETRSIGLAEVLAASQEGSVASLDDLSEAAVRLIAERFKH